MDEWVESPIQSNLDVTAQSFKIGQIVKKKYTNEHLKNAIFKKIISFPRYW